MDGIIGLAATLAILIALGAAIGLLDRQNFAPRWLVIAALLLVVNDLLLTNVYTYDILPEVIGGNWNWQGKLLALCATLAVAAHPAFGWRRIGLTFAQEPGSLKSAIPVALAYIAFFLIIAILFPGDKPTAEDVAFQLTMPGFEEEPFWRGTFLLALSQAFTGRKRFLGVDWGWGVFLSCLLFGMGHGFSFADGRFSFDALTVALTSIPSLLGVWLVLRTKSLLLPVLLHNFGNSIGFLV